VGFFVWIFMLTQERLKELFHYDPEIGVFTRKTKVGRYLAESASGAKHNKGYLQITVDGGNHLAHRLAWLYVYGHFPINQIDHINRIKTDNSIKNLRDVDASTNHHNVGLRCHNTSGFTGVVRDTRSGKWIAQIIYKTKRYYIGSFDDVELAVIARKQKEKELMYSEQQVPVDNASLYLPSQ
jgi:hypothetical protein